VYGYSISFTDIDLKIIVKIKIEFSRISNLLYYRKKYFLLQYCYFLESWYSATPEVISRMIAERCTCDLIIDGFCGAGSNSIQFALTSKKGR